MYGGEPGVVEGLSSHFQIVPRRTPGYDDDDVGDGVEAGAVAFHVRVRSQLYINSIGSCKGPQLRIIVKTIESAESHC